MDEYEPITGELRGAGRESDVYHVMSDTVDRTVTFDGDRFDDLCDNIDGIHAQLERDFDRLKAERDSMAAALDAAQGEHAYAPESHYMMLPKDADGKPVHVGDVIEWCDSGETIVVEGVGNDILFYIDGESAEWTAARNKRHYAPTVEDVLFEFAQFWSDEELTDIEHLQPHAAQTIADFAAKLRLADGKE